MSKNNKKTMNKRTHNSFEVYNNNNPNDNLTEEFSAEFNSKTKNKYLPYMKGERYMNAHLSNPLNQTYVESTCSPLKVGTPVD